MHKTSFVFSINAPLGAGKGALFISNGTYEEPGRTLDQYELIFVRKGCLRVQEGDQSYIVGPGQTTILAPGVYHQCREISTEPLKQYWVRFTCPDSTDQTGSTKIYVPKVTTIASPDRLQQLWQMYMEEKRHDPISQFTADLLVTLLLCEVAQAGAVVTESIGVVDALCVPSQDIHTRTLLRTN